MYLSTREWKAVIQHRRQQGYGYESIPKDSLCFKAPSLFLERTPDITKVDVIRIVRQKARLIGHVHLETFYVFWIDFDFKAYKHS